MHGFRGESRMRYLMRIRKCLLAHALAFYKYHGLQQQVVLPSFTLHVVNHVRQLYVSVEPENRHRRLRVPQENIAAVREFPVPASRHLKITNSIQSQGLDTV